MNIFGLPISWKRVEKSRSSVPSNRGWWPLILESFTGAWQKNVEVRLNSVLAFHAVFACQTLIASDISKLRIKLVAKDSDGIWSETANPAYSPVLRKPNHFQNRMQFYESWVLSKLQHGNVYVLKQRDGRGVVVRLYVLDPTLVTPLVADNGDVYYELNTDTLSGLPAAVTVPASEIIHDRFNCFFHPLVGLSPIFANGLAATQGLAIQNSSTQYYQNGSMPGGILVAAGHIDQNDAEEMKAAWEANYGGRNRGKVAVLGDGLKFEQLSMKNTDAQTIEQLKWSAEVVCSTYHVPPYKIGIGQAPTYNNVQALNVEYYSQALQVLIEAIELCLDEGLNTGESLGTEFDLDNLLRMDSVTQMEVLEKASGKMTIDEIRRRLGLGKIRGGDDVYLQQQNYSLTALQKRDQRDDPFGTGSGSTPAPASDEEPEMTPAAAQDAARAILEAEFKDMAPVLALPKPQRAA
ncbi:phage portal protein [Devosia sp. D6-9]|nr:phage portal protein [Devosia sp. D6-9]